MLRNQILEIDKKTGAVILTNTLDWRDTLVENAELRKDHKGPSRYMNLRARIPIELATSVKDPDLISALACGDKKALDRWLAKHPRFAIAPQKPKGKPKGAGIIVR